MYFNATHVWREVTPEGTLLHEGIYVPELGFLLIRPKHCRADTEMGVYRLLRTVNTEDVFTMYEAERQNWVQPRRPALVTRGTRVQKAMFV